MDNRIKALREARGLSLEALANKAGTTNQQISFLEAGKRRLTVEWLIRLSNALACHPWEIVSRDLPKSLCTKDIRLLDRFRKLTELQQDAVLQLVEAFPVSPRRGTAQES